MPYTLPAATAADFVFAGTVYSRPAATAADFVFSPAAVTGVGAVTLEISAAAEGTHTAPVAQEHVGVAAATLDITAAASGVHGVAGSAGAALDVGAGVIGAHGVAGGGECSVEFTAAAAAVHERYELRGEVRQAGVLVNRHVRAHRRDTGALVGESDTVAGRFHIHTGFAPAEHYIVPVHLDVAATDWTPPVANRVLSVLAQDV